MLASLLAAKFVPPPTLKIVAPPLAGGRCIQALLLLLLVERFNIRR